MVGEHRAVGRPGAGAWSRVVTRKPELDRGLDARPRCQPSRIRCSSESRPECCNYHNEKTTGSYGN
jgi:hypothetical protein